MLVRHVLSGLTLAAGICALAAPLSAQTVDARLIGLGGLHLGRSGSLTRYNAAYRAVPERKEQGLGGKFTIPIPLGLIKFFHDHPISKLDKDPLFHPDSAGFNPVETLNLILNPPLFYEIRKAPTPTNDVVCKKIAALPAEKARARKKCIGTIGARARSSQATKTMASSPPATSEALTSKLPQPALFPRTSPHTSPREAPETLSRPPRSSEVRGPKLCCTRLSTSATISRPIGTLSQKIHCQARP